MSDIANLIVMTVVGLVAAGLIPWAYLMERRLAQIEGRLTHGLIDALDRLERALTNAARERQEHATKCDSERMQFAFRLDDQGIRLGKVEDTINQ